MKGEGHRAPRSRIVLGGACFLVAQSLPLFIPLVLASDLRSEIKTALSGLMLFGLPEIGSFIAVSILGKPGYDWLRARISGVIKGVAPAADVGPTRYYAGLTILCLLLLIGFFEPYMTDLLPKSLHDNRLVYASVADALFAVNLILLGGDFWDKLRALFVYQAKARFS
jgi:hypothetical protein